jgi:hypothetical protein
MPSHVLIIDLAVYELHTNGNCFKELCPLNVAEFFVMTPSRGSGN